MLTATYICLKDYHIGAFGDRADVWTFISFLSMHIIIVVSFLLYLEMQQPPSLTSNPLMCLKRYWFSPFKEAHQSHTPITPMQTKAFLESQTVGTEGQTKGAFTAMSPHLPLQGPLSFLSSHIIKDTHMYFSTAFGLGCCLAHLTHPQNTHFLHMRQM